MTSKSPSIRPPRLGLLLLLSLALIGPSSLSGAGLADLHSVWQFENNVNESNGGSPLTPTGFIPNYSSEMIGGAAANVLDLAAMPPTHWLEMPNGVGANGGSSGLTNDWTLVMDVNFPALDTDAALLQTDLTNSNDAEVHVLGGPGVQYEYFETAALSQLPDFDALSPVATGTVQNFDISPRLRDDDFAFRFRGRIRIATAGLYTFYTTSDDGSQLKINGNLVVDNDGLHSEQTVSSSLSLSEGTHDIEVTFFERTGQEVLTVEYEGPGIARQVIPASVLTQGDAGALRMGATRLADPGSIQTGKWHRLAITTEVSGTNLLTKVYLDGAQTLVGGAPVTLITPFDGNYALPANGKLFADDNSETQAVKVNSVALFGCPLTSTEIAALGAPVAPGCPDLVVSNNNNDGFGSLRGSIDNVRNGGFITFDYAVSGATIILGSDGDLDITGRTMTIDALHLPARPTVDGADTFRIFNVLAGADVTVRGIHMTGGSAPLGEEGGAVHVESILTLERCDITNSTADVGGGVFNESGGLITLTECTISGNFAGAGGGVSNAGTAVIDRCTISGNTAGSTGGVEDINITTLTNCTIANNSATDGGGGGLSGFGTMNLINCTVSGNDSFDFSGFDGGGGLHVDFVANVTIENTIVAGNTSNVSGEENIGGFGIPNLVAANLTSGDPLLELLGDFGGPTHTMPPKADSPAAAAGTVTGKTPVTDQRGLPRINNVMDVGSVETPFDQNTTLYTEWAVNNISDPNQRGFLDDPDGDRVSNLLEYAFRMDPDVFDSLSQPLAYRSPPTVLHADLEIVIPMRNTATDAIYILQETTDLQIWTEIYRYNVFTGTETLTDTTLSTSVDTGAQTITITDANVNFNPVTTFWRVGVQSSP